MEGATPRKMSTPTSKEAAGATSRGSSGSPADGKTSEEAASLSAKLGDLVLTEKEQKGF